MSILFKGNLEEGNYTLIKSTDGWVLKGKTSYVGFNFADRPQGEWRDMGDFEKCSVCKATHLKEFQSYYGKVIWIKTPYCPQCGARMKGVGDE